MNAGLRLKHLPQTPLTALVVRGEGPAEELRLEVAETLRGAGAHRMAEVAGVVLEGLCGAELLAAASRFVRLDYRLSGPSELTRKAVAELGANLGNVPLPWRDEALEVSAVAQDGLALQYVAHERRRRGLCALAVRRHPGAIQHVPEALRTNWMWASALRRDGCLLNELEKQKRTVRLCTLAVRSTPEAVRFVPDEDVFAPIFYEAPRLYGHLRHIPAHRLDGTWLWAAIQKRPDAAAEAPAHLMSYSLWLEAVSRKGALLAKVPTEHLSAALIQAALANDPAAVAWMRPAEMSMACLGRLKADSRALAEGLRLLAKKGGLGWVTAALLAPATALIRWRATRTERRADPHWALDRHLWAHKKLRWWHRRWLEKAVAAEPLDFNDLPHRVVTPKLCRIALEKADTACLSEIFLTLFAIEGFSLRKHRELVKVALRRDGRLLRFLSLDLNRDPELVAVACAQSPRALFEIRNAGGERDWQERLFEALAKDPATRFVAPHGESIGEAEVRAALRDDGTFLQAIPAIYRTPERCAVALENTPLAFCHLPKHLMLEKPPRKTAS